MRVQIRNAESNTDSQNVHNYFKCIVPKIVIYLRPTLIHLNSL